MNLGQIAVPIRFETGVPDGLDLYITICKDQPPERALRIGLSPADETAIAPDNVYITVGELPWRYRVSALDLMNAAKAALAAMGRL